MNTRALEGSVGLSRRRVGWGDNSVNKLPPEHTHFIDFESESIKLKESISQPI